MQITRILVVLDHSVAHVTVYTDAPSPYGNGVSGGLYMQFDAPPETVEQYCRDTFGIMPNVMDTRVPW
jgi:hypothetical protein